MFVELVGHHYRAVFYAERRKQRFEHRVDESEDTQLFDFLSCWWEAKSIITIRESGEDCPCIVVTKCMAQEEFDDESFENALLGDCWRERATMIADESAFLDAALAALVRKYRKRTTEISPHLSIGDCWGVGDMDLYYNELVAAGILFDSQGQRHLPLENRS